MRRVKDFLFLIVCNVITWSCLAFIIFLCVHILNYGLDFLSFDFLTRFPSRFPHKSGILSSLIGTCYLMLVVICFSLPLGLVTGIFIQEYLSKKTKRGFWFGVNIASLAGMPSVIYGLVGLAIFSNFLRLNNSLLAGGLTLGLLILPVIVITTQEALKSIPKDIRYAAYSLGARPYQVIFQQVVPAALSQIMTGLILALSRAVGETAPLIVIGGLTYAAFLPETLMDPFSALPLQIYNWAGKPQEDFHKLASSGIVVLLCVMFFMNFIALFIRQRYQRYKK